MHTVANIYRRRIAHVSRNNLLGALFMLGAIAGPATSSAYCIGNDTSLPGYDSEYYSVSHEYGRSKYVVRAQVIGETWLDEDGKPKKLEPPFQNGGPRPWGFDPYIGAFYDVKVTHSFKGTAPGTLRLFSSNSTARFWLFVGDDVLLLVTEEQYEAPIGKVLTLDTCGNSAMTDKAQDLLHELQKLEDGHR